MGAKEIVQAHGMTVGELARYFDGEFLEADVGGRLAELSVIEVAGWRRDMPYAATGLPWVMPSPNMPTPDTALVYPGTGMFEGTNLSEGRGTTRPFELVGRPVRRLPAGPRPWLALDLPGVGFREAYFTPRSASTRARSAEASRCTSPTRRTFDPMRGRASRCWSRPRSLYADFAWRYDSYDPARPYWIDKLTGSTRLREQITAGASADEVVGAWRDELAAFDDRRQQYLLYRGPAA